MAAAPEPVVAPAHLEDREACVYHDETHDLPRIDLAQIDLGNRVVPAHRWCWTHGAWEQPTLARRQPVTRGAACAASVVVRCRLP